MPVLGMEVDLVVPDGLVWLTAGLGLAGLLGGGVLLLVALRRRTRR